MKKIKNLQELQAEKARLTAEIADERAQMLYDFKAITKNLTVLSVGAMVGKSIISGLFSSNRHNGNGNSHSPALASWMPANSFAQKGIEYGSAWLISKMVKNPLLKTVTILGLPILVKYYPAISGAVRRLWSKRGNVR